MPRSSGWRILCSAMASLPRISFLGDVSSFLAPPLCLREAIRGVAMEGAFLWHGQSSIPRPTGRERLEDSRRPFIYASLRRIILTIRPHREINLPRVAATSGEPFPRSKEDSSSHQCLGWNEPERMDNLRQPSFDAFLFGVTSIVRHRGGPNLRRVAATGRKPSFEHLIESCGSSDSEGAEFICGH